MLSERIPSRAGGNNKIAVWHLMNDMWLIREGDITMDDVASRHGLDADERAELESVLGQINAKGNARDKDFMDTWQVLIALERDVLTWEQAKAKLGVN